MEATGAEECPEQFELTAPAGAELRRPEWAKRQLARASEHPVPGQPALPEHSEWEYLR